MKLNWAVIVCFGVLSAVPSSQLPAAVDLKLVIAVDVSYSMDIEEQRVQREGYVAAFRSPEIVRALSSGPLGKVAVTYVEWGGFAIQVVPWMIIDGQVTAARFAEELRRQPPRRISFTSISNALAFARELIDSSRVRSSRRVVDVSGDGPNNAGAPVPVARNAAIADAITVDGLPIMLNAATDPDALPDLDDYYAACVIGGEGAFLLKVTDVSHFEDAIRNKLVVEITGVRLSDYKGPPAETVQYLKPYNCLIGEEAQERGIGK
ncbi:MAG: DUF1194 domain-containing protein [Phyllobacterium sp.]|uniref:DUF1194 domain-containing protein n=1 Tax=Phyllobacterium sp. TaxID=1871046 RepID=UPI0030F1CD56